jgi:DNA-binding CsgD family transcriptional regulator
LLGVEVVIRRTLQFAVLTLLVVAVYAATAAISALVADGTGSRVVAAAAVALVLRPLRDRLPGGVDRLVYGARRDPLGAIRRVGASVSAQSADTGVITALAAPVAAVVHATQLTRRLATAHERTLAAPQRALAAADAGRPARPFPDLTLRERQVLDLLADGARNSEIAGQLGMTDKTVRNHVSAILMKLQVTDRTAAAIKAATCAGATSVRPGGRARSRRRTRPLAPGPAGPAWPAGSPRAT